MFAKPHTIYPASASQVSIHKTPPAQHLRKSLTGSILANWVAMAVSASISLLLTPLLIHQLGHLFYGMWILTASVLDYYGILDMGLRPTVQRFVARYQGVDERAGLNTTLATALSLSCGLCVLICVLSVFIAPAMPLVFAIYGKDSHAFQQLIILLGLSAAFTFPGRVLGAYLCGLQRYDLYNLNSIAGSLLRAALLVLVLRLGYGILGCGVVALLTTLFSLVMSACLVIRADQGMTVAWRYVSGRHARELLSFSFYMFLASAGDLLRTRLDSLVIARWLGVALVTPYNVAARLIECFRTIMFSLLGPLLTEMSSLDAQSSDLKLKNLFMRSSRMTALFSCCVTALLFMNGKALLRHWLDSAFVSSFSVLMVLAVGRCLAVGQTPSVVLLIARGRNRFVGWMTVIEGLANLGLSIYWVRSYGLIGVAMGTLVPLIATKCVIQPLYTVTFAKLSILEYLQKAIAPGLIACASSLAVCETIGLSTSPESSLLSFLAKLLAQVALFSVLAYILGLSGEDRQFVGRLTRRIVLAKRANALMNQEA
jgi:O-antigen/teichoic acid export membrane protein